MNDFREAEEAENQTISIFLPLVSPFGFLPPLTPLLFPEFIIFYTFFASARTRGGASIYFWLYHMLLEEGFKVRGHLIDRLLWNNILDGGDEPYHLFPTVLYDLYTVPINLHILSSNIQSIIGTNNHIPAIKRYLIITHFYKEVRVFYTVEHAS